QHACNKHKCSAESDLHGGGKPRRIHVASANPCNGCQFGNYDPSGCPECKMKVAYQKWQGMTDAAHGSHRAADQTAYPRMSASGQPPITRQGLREPQAEARADRCRKTDKKGFPAVMGSQGRGKYWRQCQTRSIH